MSQPVRVTLRTALLSAGLPVLLAISRWLSQRQRLPTPDQPCDLQNWGCSTGTSLIGMLLFVGVPVVFPLLVVYVQHQLIWRTRTVLTVPQVIASLLPAPLILSLVAVVLGARGEDELVGFVFLAWVPTTVVAALQQISIRRRLLRQEELRPRSSPLGTPLVHLLLSCYTLLLLIGAVLTWGPSGKSSQQLVPGITLLLLFLTVCSGIYATFAFYFVVRSLTLPTSAGRIVRALSVVAGIVGVAAIGAWCLLTAILQDEVAQKVTASGSVYLGTKGDYPPVCYHLYNGGPLMERDCVLAEELGLTTPEPELPNDLAGESSPEPQSPQSAPQPPEGPASSGTVGSETVVASHGDSGIIQIDASLGGKGTYAFAQHLDGSWTPSATIIEDASFTDFVTAHGLLFTAFAPSPDFSLMVSSDDGRSWQRADFHSAAIPEDMRYFHDLTYTGVVFTLTTGYPSWVDSDQTNQWISNDGLAWQQLHP